MLEFGSIGFYFAVYYAVGLLITTFCEMMAKMQSTELGEEYEEMPIITYLLTAAIYPYVILVVILQERKEKQ